jgi:hypothetical protein
MVMIKHQMEFLEAKKVSEQLNLLLEQIRGTENIINKFWLEEECTIREDFN